MKPVTQELLRQAAAAFAFDRPAGEAERFGAGHINDTFAVWAADRSKRWILQRINTDTFTDPAGLMENVTGVTAYLRRQIIERGGDPDRETLNVIPTLDGKPYYTDTEGGAWRAYIFVEGTVCLQKVENERDFYTAAETFGNFQNQLAGYPAATLHETIARFHDTPNRYANFEKALAADVMGRAKDVGPEIAFIRAREADCRVLVDQLAAGVLPLRVTHNDTKLNNVLIDQETGKGICVIDLDTVMPGLSAYDFGDSIRFGANDCAEDEPDQSKVHFSLHLYKVFAEGYLAAAGSAMTEAERRSLPWGAKLMTLECGIRFLTDYLEGDHYFKISRPDQNLDRARTQFTLVQGMEREFDAMTQLALEL
ncbi:MAG TPA: aminoglycoside phosphotransferase family protein [Candidatus Faecalibacterium faecigallinarum]|uniref:Aminoglycoside phosphotransferase family protein n=1 Tax=Candidatus Faecalibacterium faecigallinarum TaxID=2838577 RepID=A0A9D2P9R2_9FIRM|nr:aminoglycoside phosphotransferase family protein [Candidatus Faecalibacterium faecigallinarum]